MTTESLPRRDLARHALRVAFTVAWIIGALLTLAIAVTVASAAGQAPQASVRQASLEH
jgi:hypothetical protein